VTTLDRLERWRSAGSITSEQHLALAAIVRNDRFSVFLELNALLYVGVLTFAAGLAWTVREHFARLGDTAVIVSLTAVFTASLYRCFTRGGPFTRGQAGSPGFAFDYILYLGCLTFAVELGFLQFRFGLLGGRWDTALLLSAVLYLSLAYRFDNRFVLSLALSTLGAWLGVRWSWNGFHVAASVRGDALVYSAILAAAGLWTYRAGIKQHFLDTYLHLAVNTGLAALVSGTIGGERRWLWLVALLAASALIGERGVRFRRFAFVAYAVVYSYVGVSAHVLRDARGVSGPFVYFIISGTIVIASLAVLSRRFGREE
jgi:hypothetical protein